MKKLLVLLPFFVFAINNIFACCHASQHRIFPIGEVGGKVVLIEMKLTRQCESMENPSAMLFQWRGLVRLSTFDGEQITPLEFSDTIRFEEQQCDNNELAVKGVYRSEILPYYERALSEARSIPNFIAAVPTSINYLGNDSTTAAILSDSTFSYSQSGNTVDVSKQNQVFLHEFMLSRAEYNYSIGSKQVVVLCFGERAHRIPKALEIENRKHFSQLESACTYETVTWHDSSMDCIFYK